MAERDSTMVCDEKGQQSRNVGLFGRIITILLYVQIQYSLVHNIHRTRAKLKHTWKTQIASTTFKCHEKMTPQRPLFEAPLDPFLILYLVLKCSKTIQNPCDAENTSKSSEKTKITPSRHHAGCSRRRIVGWNGDLNEAVCRRRTG